MQHASPNVNCTYSRAMNQPYPRHCIVCGKIEPFIPDAKALEPVKDNLYTPGCIRTFTGKYINILHPTEDMICIEDIAHSLSMQCRFGGHLPRFYSVAEHCSNAHPLVKKEHKLQALMHDASEAYLMDIPTPVKDLLTNYKDIEHGLMVVIAKKFGFEWPMSSEVKEADRSLLVWEWKTIMLSPDKISMYGPACFSQAKAETDFLYDFNRLTK